MSETVTAPASSNALPIEIQQHMALAFGEQPPAIPQEPAATPETPASAATPETPVATPAVPTAQSAEQIIDANEYLKQQTGYESWEAIKAELQVINDLKAKAQTPAEHKFANDEAKRWYEYFNQGKEDELYSSLHARQQIKNIDGMNDEQKIKLFIKMQNPLFDQELIDYQFKKEYGFDEAAFKDEEGNITDSMGLRFAKVAAQQKMQNDLAKATDYFSQYKSKIQLPAIEQQAAPPDQAYEDYKASTAKDQEVYEKVIVPALKALSEADLNMTIAINDENNQMKFETSISVDKEDFVKAQQAALDYYNYLNNHIYDPSGKFMGNKLIKTILLAENFDKYAQSMMRQAVNAERKRMIEAETPDNGVRKMYTQEVKTELDKQMERAFAV